MEFKSRIDTTFQRKAFLRPLFYSYNDGLRFELSEGGSKIHQFLLAMQKATAVCNYIFDEEKPISVCLRIRFYKAKFAYRRELSELTSAGIKIPRKIKEIWIDLEEKDDWNDAHVQDWWINVAFDIPMDLLQNILWCALSHDFGSIRPNPRCIVYLFNFEKEIIVRPYDDRGMDVAGGNKGFLFKMYMKHSAYLLDYDREGMDDSFKTFNRSFDTNASRLST